MRVRNFTLASAVAQSNGLYFLHGAGIDEINVGQFPHIHPTISLFITIVIEAMDPAGDHELKVELTEQDGQVIDVITEGSFALPERPEGADREEGVMQLVAHKVGLTVPHEGRYWVTLRLRSMQLDRIPLHFAAVSSQQPPQDQ
jgi:hypothetical protein